VTVLHSRAGDGLTLARAIELAAFGSGIALLASPSRYEVADLRDGVCRGPAGPCALDEVFEARVFDGGLELRWLHSASGHGRAVVLAENEAELPADLGERLPELTAVHLFDQNYLLWGMAAAPQAGGWTTLFSARIGTISVPLASSGPGRKVRLRAREYVAVEPAYGNAYVAEERLLGLEEITR
jgi:CRISPR-associated protein (TIGR03984 family)